MVERYIKTGTSFNHYYGHVLPPSLYWQWSEKEISYMRKGFRPPPFTYTSCIIVIMRVIVAVMVFRIAVARMILSSWDLLWPFSFSRSLHFCWMIHQNCYIVQQNMGWPAIIEINGNLHVHVAIRISRLIRPTGTSNYQIWMSARSYRYDRSLFAQNVHVEY